MQSVETTSAVGGTLKRRREELGRTQEQVAKRVGITRGNLANVENNRTTPSFETLQKLIRVLS